MGADAIRLSHILSRDVEISWFETVAIVHGLCRTIIDTGDAASEFPTPESVVICEDGTLDIIGHEKCARPAVAAGQLLGTLLEADAPPSLTAIARQAAEGSAGLATLGVLAETLSYFERPGSERLVAEVRTRVARASDRSEPRVMPAPEPPPLPRETRPASTTKSARFQLSRRTLIAGAAAVVIVVAAAGVFFASTPAGASEWSAEVARVSQSLVQAIAGTASAWSGKLFGGPSSVAAEATTAAEKPATDDKRATGKTENRPAPPADIVLPTTAPQKKVRGSPNMRAVPLKPAAPPGSAPSGVSADEDLADYVESDAGELPNYYAIYSRENVAVSPPTPINRFVAQESTATRQTILELIIGIDGSVESARLVGYPITLPDVMFMHAAKAWKFTPASLDGRPVRYRYQLQVP